LSLALFVSVSYVCFWSFFAVVFCCFSFSNSPGHYQSNFPIGSDRVFLSSASPDSFVANSQIPDVLRLNAAIELNWRRPFHGLNSASQSDPVSVTAQEEENASPAMNEVSAGTRTKDRCVASQAPDSIRTNSESVSNEIDESEWQFEKQCEQRI
jgi:hypothetical protein